MSEENKPLQEAPKQYGADSIQVLEGLEAVRKRPAMYIGDIGEKGLHHLVYEVVDNSIDEALAGYCKNIQVTIHEDNSISVQDDGRGIPTAMHTKEKRSALEVVMTVLHAGGKFDKNTYKVSGGLHGVGVSCVNALSKDMHVTVHREGKIFEQEYKIGVPQYAVREIGTSDKTGTTVRFWPDDTIFQTTVYKRSILEGRLRELAFLNRKIAITLTDLRELDEQGTPYSSHFYSEGGIVEFVEMLDKHSNRTPLIAKTLYFEGYDENSHVAVEVAMTYNDDFKEHIFSYVNNINTIEGGTHVTGFRTALTRVFKSYGDREGLFEKAKVEVEGDDFREGLSAIVSVKVPEPQLLVHWNHIWKKIRKKLRTLFQKLYLLHKPGLLLRKHANLFRERLYLVEGVFLVSWQIVVNVILKNVSYTWWREIVLAELQNKGVIVLSKQLCLCVVKS